MSNHLGVSDTARLLRVSESAVRAMEKAGKLQALRTSSGHRIFDRAVVERIAAERSQERRGQ